MVIGILSLPIVMFFMRDEPADEMVDEDVLVAVGLVQERREERELGEDMVTVELIGCGQTAGAIKQKKMICCINYKVIFLLYN